MPPTFAPRARRRQRWAARHAMRWATRAAPGKMGAWVISTSAASGTCSPTGVRSSTTSRSASATAHASRSSAPTVRARRRCCGSSPATSSRTPAPWAAAAGSGSCARTSGGSTTTARSGTCWPRWPRRPSGTRRSSSRRPSWAIMEVDDEPAQMRYAQALVDWADVGGYEAEAGWDRVTDAVLSIPFEQAQHREVRTLSGGEQKRLVLEALLRGPDEVLLLDEPDNALDVPTKRWLEDKLRASNKTVLFVSHDREMLARVATQVATLEPGVMGAAVWVHGGGFAHVPPGAGGPALAARGAAAALGGGAREAQGARADPQDEGGVQRRPRVAVLGGADAAAQVRGGRSAHAAGPRAERPGAAARRADREARGRRDGSRAHRADEAVRPRGLVRRARRGARLQRLGQVALPAAARGRRQRPRAPSTPLPTTSRWRR